jgi:murein DD-endopeptidase MepM/ murein hydrolase activator NlpD
MKKILKYIFLFILIFTIGIKVEAKTLKDLKNELAAYEKEMANAKNKKNLEQAEINSVNARVKTISETIEKNQNRIKEIEDEIVVLENKSDEKEGQIKNVISFLQVSNSENAYLEYIFGAKSIEDLVLRSAVSEQMVAYNDNLITEYNESIVDYKKKNNELKVEIENLDKEQDNLNAELVKLGDSIKSLSKEMSSVEQQIASQKKIIEYYEKTLGCKDDQNIQTCGKIPFSGKMIRPLNSGGISSEFGYRRSPINGGYELHSGIDMYGSTDVYATAPGTVAGISWKNSCGGTILFVHHNINGRYYTSAYMHVYKVLVNVGDYVDQNTKIAITGGTPSLTPWDRCTTGRHLHFMIANGLYMKDYVSWNALISRLVNPRTMVNFPKLGGWFSNRTTVY